MLDIGRPPQRIGGLTVFHDHARLDLRYVLAEVPRLVANPDPQLSLLLYRGATAGGLLQLECTLAPTEKQLADVARELSIGGRLPILARPDWRSGTVRLAGWLATDELAPKMLFVGAPSLVGDPGAVIAARLDAPAAALADAALRGNALPTAVIFELDTLGLAGPLSVEAEADLHALHDRLTAEGALTTPYGRARIAKTWELAARDNVIKVRILDESGDVESQRAEAMRRIGEDLIARMFSPFPPPERPPQLEDGTIAPIELSFRLTMRREELATSSRWDFRERRAMAIRHFAAASLIDLLGAHSPDRHIMFADLSELTRDVVVRVEPELEKLGLSAVEVDLRASATGPIERTIVLSDQQPEARITRTSGGSALQYRMRTRFDPSRTSAPDRESDWMTAEGGLVALSARRTFPPRMFTVVAGRVEFDWLDHVEVLVAASGEPARSLRLTGEIQSADAFLPGAGRNPLTVTTHWRGRPGEPVRDDPPREVGDDFLVLDSPFADSLSVFVIPLFLSGVGSLVVELKTEHSAFVHSRTLEWAAPDREPKRVALRRLAGSPRRYLHRVLLIHEDGRLEQMPWGDADAANLIVGVRGDVDARAVEVVVLGGGPAGRGALAIELVLESGVNSEREVLEGDRDHATLTLVVPRGAPPSVLTAREFLNSGETRETRWVNPESLAVLDVPAVTP
jgi:hypothetical protein